MDSLSCFCRRTYHWSRSFHCQTQLLFVDMRCPQHILSQHTADVLSCTDIQCIHLYTHKYIASYCINPVSHLKSCAIYHTLMCQCLQRCYPWLCCGCMHAFVIMQGISSTFYHNQLLRRIQLYFLYLPLTETVKAAHAYTIKFISVDILCRDSHRSSKDISQSCRLGVASVGLRRG